MGLTMSEKRALTDQVVRRYRRAGKKEKGVILGEFVQTTGYRRKYAIHLLELMGPHPLGEHRRQVGESRRRSPPALQAPPPTASLRPGGTRR